MMRALRSFLLVSLLAVAQASSASFHFMHIEEIYSNADGTVQYIVLRVTANNQHRMTLATLRTTGPGNVIQNYAFPNDLPSMVTNGHAILIGTQGFAALNLVTPDYTIPNGFIPTVNGIVNYGLAVDVWSYVALPTDGVNALYASSVVNPNLATNFAGASAPVVPMPTKLVITNVNGGFYPIVGTPFNVGIQAQDNSGVPRPVLADTTATLSVQGGSTSFGGTQFCTIVTAQSSCIVTGVQPFLLATGVVLRADCCGLAPGFSAPFDVIGAAGPTPIFALASSRKTHGALGAVDILLNAGTTSPTIEPRTGPGHTIVFTFQKASAGATVVVTEGIATTAAPTFGGVEVTVGLSGVADQQYVSVSLTNVASVDGGTGGSGSVRLGFLAGDVNSTGVVTLSDLGLVNAQLAQPVTLGNFLKDVNASGTMSLADKAIVNNNLTKALPPP